MPIGAFDDGNVGGLAIIGVLLAVGAGYSKAMQKYRLNEAESQVSIMVSNYAYYMRNTH